MRDLALKPREENELPVEKLVDVLSAIYPEKTVEDALKNLGYEVEEVRPKRGKTVYFNGVDAQTGEEAMRRERERRNDG